MKLIVCKPRGFCAGVVRAIETVERALELFGKPIYVKHQIVHNHHVVSRLEQKGAIFIEELNEVPRGSRIVYSAHGVSPEVRKEAKQRDLIEIDATCSLVTKVHSAALRFALKGFHILLIGHKNHVEVIGTMGEAPSQTTVIETSEDVLALNFSQDQPLFYITQTTLSIDDVQEIVEAILKKYPKAQTLPSSSICYATTNRQMAVKQIAADVDLILVVGDPLSSNSNRLTEVAKNSSVPSFLIQQASDIDEAWLSNVKSIGLTAGASTPEDIVEGCIKRLMELGALQVEEVEVIKEDVYFHLPKQVQSLNLI